MQTPLSDFLQSKEGVNILGGFDKFFPVHDSLAVHMREGGDELRSDRPRFFLRYLLGGCWDPIQLIAFWLEFFWGLLA